MKKILALILAIVLLVVLLVTVFSVTKEEECVPSGQGTGWSRGIPGGVPDGELSLPQKDAMAHTTSEFGPRWGTAHNGIDIAQGAGTPIYAFADGVVSAAGPATGFGQWIIIDHNIEGQVISTVYGHMMEDGLHVKVGDQVKAGQHIADEGYNGEVSPPGPGGAHLHFEVHEGGYFTGGGPVNPRPWLEKAVEPGTGSGETSTPARPAEKSEQPAGGSLPPSDKIASEEKLQINSIRIARAVAANFPQIETIGGWRPYDAYPDHPSGRAVDIMIPNYESEEGKKLGDDILAYLFGNAEFFGVEYFIWRQEYIPAEGQSNIMEDRGDPTQNHFDHIHVTTIESGFPPAGYDFGSAPSGGSTVPGSAGGNVNDDCQPRLKVDDHLHTDEIPEELVKWIQLGGQVCQEVSSPLLAGLIEHESAGFQAQAVSPVGAQGYGQFMPGTWASVGAEVDDNGKVVGPPGSGSPSDPADASMAAARYLCSIAEDQRPLIESGDIKGDPTELMLAGYNAGPGAVQQYGGVPPYAETQKYVKIVPETAAKHGY
ncbi:peptidoglycan DD-metalloendopeptidase family protein [Ancrocorticia populi]|uniref:peptidoglycan DD-metalloendopeptidase family protein n=1 Tax=Ancrocorticia populi TaxID=2175228 RepID=UPI003F9B3FA7